MRDYRELAKVYREKGLTVIPVDSLKQPTIKWTKYQDRSMEDWEIEKHFKNVHGLALVCGGKGQVFCIDLDKKYFLAEDLIDRLKEEIPNEILKKLWVQSTPSGGYHWIFTCEEVGQNEKLANRHTTAEEKHNTYIEAFNNPKTRDIALKIATNDRTKVLLETRGNGGYFLVAPTPGYKKVYGSLSELTIEEKDILLEACRSFNEFKEEKKNYEVARYANFDDNPFEDYNENGDPLSLLLQSGWEIIYESSQNIRLKRPGGSYSKSSALFDKGTKVLNVFSTSTVFDVNVGYSPVNIFITLEAGGDTKEAYKKLKDLGYGAKKED